MDRDKAEETAVGMLLSFESYKEKAYPDRDKNDPNCRWTFGVGATFFNGRSVKEGDSISYEDALILLKEEVNNLSLKIENWADNNHVTLTENELASLISISFNIGFHRFTTSSLSIDIINNRKENIKLDFDKFSKINVNNELITSNGLLSRREKEFHVFIS